MTLHCDHILPTMTDSLSSPRLIQFALGLLEMWQIVKETTTAHSVAPATVANSRLIFCKVQVDLIASLPRGPLVIAVQRQGSSIFEIFIS